MCIVSSAVSSNVPTQAAPFPLEKKMFMFIVLPCFDYNYNL